MSQPRKPSSRQKSCFNCVHAKARCDLEPKCSRCRQKRLECEYSRPSTILDRRSTSASTVSSGSAFSLSNIIHGAVDTPLSAPPDNVHFEIGSRWLDALVVPPGKIPKHFTASTISYMSSVLKSYPRIVAQDTEPEFPALPPFVHPQQATSANRPFANCRSVLRMWDKRAGGSEGFVRETIAREMNSLIEEHRAGKLDGDGLLNACQAYLLYTLHLFFCGNAESSAMVETATIINVQELSSAMAALGLHDPAVLTWEAWIAAEAKRRTVYTMYMFENVFNYNHGSTSYVATELGRLPLVATGAMWNARSEREWAMVRSRFVREWQAEPPVMENLWPHEDEGERTRRREILDKWVESVDAFGMFLYSLTSMTYPK